MADTRYIRVKVEPYLRRWLSKKCRGMQFFETKIKLSTGGYHKFDAVTKDVAIIAAFVCNRAKTATGKENTGGVRKALNDLQFLNLLPAFIRRFFVFTDKEFLRLIRKRGRRVGTRGIKFLHCKLPENLASGLESVLNLSRREQTRLGLD